MAGVGSAVGSGMGAGVGAGVGSAMPDVIGLSTLQVRFKTPEVCYLALGPVWAKRLVQEWARVLTEQEWEPGSVCVWSVKAWGGGVVGAGVGRGVVGAGVGRCVVGEGVGRGVVGAGVGRGVVGAVVGRGVVSAGVPAAMLGRLAASRASSVNALIMALACNVTSQVWMPGAAFIRFQPCARPPNLPPLHPHIASIMAGAQRQSHRPSPLQR